MITNLKEINIDSLFEKMSYMDELNTMYESPQNSFERKIVLRQYYMDAMPEIINLARQSLSAWASVYPFDWKFNENEQSLWSSIRSNPMVMYPEFPVFNYFVDFGNPYLRIAIEADSKKFHSKEKDAERDRKLLQINWKTFRVSYEENFTPFKELGDIAEMISMGNESEAMEEMENWVLKTSDGVVDAIYFFYFMSDKEKENRMKKFPSYVDLAERTLKKHRLVDFELPNLSIFPSYRRMGSSQRP
jgi:very-short-patch-repair endonuclease